MGLRYVSFVRDNEIQAQLPTNMTDDDCITVDALLQLIGKLEENEEICITGEFEKEDE
jgi:hypothetical protein